MKKTEELRFWIHDIGHTITPGPGIESQNWEDIISVIEHETQVNEAFVELSNKSMITLSGKSAEEIKAEMDLLKTKISDNRKTLKYLKGL
jgi:hypothetical protein